MGHSLGFSFQVAPERDQDGKVFSGFYVARFPGVPWLTLTLNGVLQDSEVSTLGSIGVKGKGRIVGGRVGFTLPGTSGFYHSVSVGVDYKHFDEGITLGEDTLATPITYWPFTAQYGASWPRDSSQTQAGVTMVANLRGLSSGTAEFDDKRYKASGSFIYTRAELSRTDDLRGLQLFERIQGQYSADPLIGSEQLTGGGAESVRGYVDVQGSGDYGALGTFEVRSPSLERWFGKPVLSECRLLAFVEGGRLVTRDALPDQKSFARFFSVGGGTRIRLIDHVGASVDVGVPLVSEGGTRQYHPRVHFRFWSEF
jgi:hemolysin activation/secretion protein